MSSVQSIWKNPLQENLHSFMRSEITRVFPALLNCGHTRFLSLYKYIDGSPESYYNTKAFKDIFDFLENIHVSNSNTLNQFLIDDLHRLDRALFFLNEINSFPWNDSTIEAHEDERIRFIDQLIHPAYLRLLEAVFYPLMRAIAFFILTKQNKSIEGVELFNVIEILKKNYPELAKGYRHIVRNGIGHGGVTYLKNEILYRDKNGNEEIVTDNIVIRLFDDLIDICNGLALGFRLFLLMHRNSNYAVPQHLFLEELKAETESPWWHIDGCIPQKLPNLNQLLIYIRVNTRHFSKVQYSAFMTAVLAEDLIRGYNRYFLSLKSTKALPGWAAFDGMRIKEIRESNPKNIIDYQNILEDNLIFFIPTPKLPSLFGTIDTFIQSYSIHLPLTLREMRRRLGRSDIIVRSTELHRNGFGSVLNGSVVIKANDQAINKELIKKNCGNIIRASLKHELPSHNHLSILHYIPVGYAQIAVFRRDYRRRRLNSFGLGSDLVCTIRINRIGRIKSPDIMGSEVEVFGKYRIAWNKAWLESEEYQSYLSLMIEHLRSSDSKLEMITPIFDQLVETTYDNMVSFGEEKGWPVYAHVHIELGNDNLHKFSLILFGNTKEATACLKNHQTHDMAITKINKNSNKREILLNLLQGYRKF